jgi:hypothetical protein
MAARKQKQATPPAQPPPRKTISWQGLLVVVGAISAGMAGLAAFTDSSSKVWDFFTHLLHSNSQVPVKLVLRDMRLVNLGWNLPASNSPARRFLPAFNSGSGKYDPSDYLAATVDVVGQKEGSDPLLGCTGELEIAHNFYDGHSEHSSDFKNEKKKSYDFSEGQNDIDLRYTFYILPREFYPINKYELHVLAESLTGMM